MVLSGKYRRKATAEPSRIPRSPVPFNAMGPVYHTCDIDGIMIPNAHRNDANAARPGGSFLGLFHAPTLYEENDPLRMTKCSVRIMTANTLDQ